MESKIVRANHSSEKQTLARQMRRQMTPAEAILWQKLRRNQMLGLQFRRQQVIEGFIADFYCREARLVIECDGEVHARQTDYDQERDYILAAHNLHILRFTNADVLHKTNEVLHQIAFIAQNRIRQQQAQLPPP